MNLGTKLELSTLVLAILANLVLSDVDFHNNKCPEYNPQNELDMELVSDLWFGTEMITHYEGRGGYSQVFDSCVIVRIEQIYEWDDYNYDYSENNRDRRFDYNPKIYRWLKLTWNELDKSAEYTLKYNITKRGLWIGAEPPPGSALRQHFHHSHYAGTVQVMKAVGNHLVLTFCEKTELFTIILTHTKNMLAADDVESVHALLGRRGLAVQAVRELCRHNSAIRLTLHTSIVFMLMMLIMGN